MSNEMFTQLPTVANASMTDIVCAVTGYINPSNIGTSVQETLQQVFNLFNANMVLVYAGNPNGVVAGTSYTLLWDSIDLSLWVCTTTGNSSTTIWQRATNVAVSPGKLLTVSNSLIFSGIDSSSVNFGGGGTVAYTTGAVIRLNTQVFTNNGTYTPTSGMLYCDIYVTASGGGGGGATGGTAPQASTGGGGGSGATSIYYGCSAAVIGVSQAVTVGVAGTAGTAGGGNGGTGNTSSLGAIVTTSGGGGGTGAASFSGGCVPSPGGSGGTVGSGGSVNMAGVSGEYGIANGISSVVQSGNGAPSFWGGGVRGVGAPSAGAAGTAYGSGGSGAGATTGNTAGGAGAAGIVVIVEYI